MSFFHWGQAKHDNGQGRCLPNAGAVHWISCTQTDFACCLLFDLPNASVAGLVATYIASRFTLKPTYVRLQAMTSWQASPEVASGPLAANNADVTGYCA